MGFFNVNLELGFFVIVEFGMMKIFFFFDDKLLVICFKNIFVCDYIYVILKF